MPSFEQDYFFQLDEQGNLRTTAKMSTSDFNMLQLEALREFLQITAGTGPVEESLELENPASWVRALVQQQKQAEQDLQRLITACGNTINRSDRRIQKIEESYQTLADGARYVFDRVNPNERIAE